MNEELESVLHYMRMNAKKYAEAKANRNYLSEFRKSKKAILCNEAEINGRKTGQEREAYAYSHPEYIALLEGLKAAIAIEEEIALNLERARIKVDIWRTQEATKRAEMMGYGNRS